MKVIESSDIPVARRGSTDLISKRVLGWTFIGASIFLLLIFGYFLITVVGPMTRPTSYFEKLTEQVGQHAASKSGEEADRLSVDLAVILEYANADIRTAGVQIAFALVAGFFFCAIGVLIFTAGITGALQLSATSDRSRFELATAAPGIVCILLGAVIIGIGISKDVRRPLDAQINRGWDVNYRTSDEPPPTTSKGEGAAEDLKRPEVEKDTPRRDQASPARP